MKQCRAKKLIVLDVGTVVQMTYKQVADRAGRVHDLGEGKYRLKESLQFKAGEVFGVDGELPKALADQVEDLTPAHPGKRARARELA